MTLVSKLFAGDAKLEECATNDSAHITTGSAGNHVALIQTALILLEGANIVADGRYGPAMASAVLAYKTKRAIINFSYQTQADNIVGKMTIARLDAEMVEFERRSDGAKICHCRDFPRAPPEAVGRSSVRVAFAVSAGVVGAPLTGTPKAQALARLPLARIWVSKAHQFISLGVAQILSGLPIDTFKDTEERKALVTHFKIQQAPNPLQHLNLLRGVYSQIAAVFGGASSIFIDDPATGDFANAHLGGFGHLTDPVLGKIRFGPAYGGKGELFQTSVLIHEAAHFVNAAIDHFASELPAPNGTSVNSSTGAVHSKTYAQLSFQEAAGNAYTYAQFALHAFKGFDKRIVPFNE